MGAVGELVRLARHFDDEAEKYAQNPDVAFTLRQAAMTTRLTALRYEADVDRAEEPRYRILSHYGDLYMVPEEFVEAFLDIAMDCHRVRCRDGGRAAIEEMPAVLKLDMTCDLSFEGLRWDQ